MLALSLKQLSFLPNEVVDSAVPALMARALQQVKLQFGVCPEQGQAKTLGISYLILFKKLVSSSTFHSVDCNKGYPRGPTVSGHK